MAEADDVVPSGFETNTGYLTNRHARELARIAPGRRQSDRESKPSTARSRISAVKVKRDAPMAPTPERLMKDDVVKVGGQFRSIPVLERLRDRRELDHDAAANDAMFRAGQKLLRHYTGAGMIGVKAQDLNRIIATGGDGLVGEENWVEHFDAFRTACKLMGWSEANPKRGAGRMVVAVVCHEETVGDAAKRIVGPGWTPGITAIGMDRLKEGLFALAVHWRMI